MVTKSVSWAADKINAVQNSNNDFVVAVSGYAGVGKSSLMMQIAAALKGDTYLSKEGFERYHIYSKKEFFDSLEKFERKELICVDEAINILFSREFYDKKQINIIKALNTYRNKLYCTFLLLPTFWHLDNSVRNSLRIKWWIHCYKRGHGIIYQAEDNEWNPDPWNQRYNFHLLRKGGKIYQSPNYIANIVWKPLTQEIFSIYEEVKDAKRREAGKDRGVQMYSKKDIITAIYLTNPKASGKVISKLLKTSDIYVYNIKTKLNEDN